MKNQEKPNSKYLNNYNNKLNIKCNLIPLQDAIKEDHEEFDYRSMGFGKNEGIYVYFESDDDCRWEDLKPNYSPKESKLALPYSFGSKQKVKRPAKTRLYPTQLRKSKEEVALAKIIRGYAHPYDWATSEIGTKDISRANIKSKMTELIQSRKRGLRVLGLKKLSLNLIIMHLRRLIDLFICPKHPSQQPKVLMALDIDVKPSEGQGTKDGAELAAKLLKEEFFKSELFKNCKGEAMTDVSTSGNGQHVFFLVDFGKKNMWDINLKVSNFKEAILALADKFLQDKKVDIKMVELKCTPQKFFYDGRFMLIDRCGQLIRCPRKVKSLDFDNLIVVKPETVVERYYNDGLTAHKTLAKSTQENITSFKSFIKSLNAEPNGSSTSILGNISPKASQKSKVKSNLGDFGQSIAANWLGEEFLEVKQIAEEAFKTLFPCGIRTTKAKREREVSAEDFGTFVVILYIKLKVKKENCPCEWIAQVWNYLRKNDFTEAYHNYSKVKTIRDALSDLGWLNWIEEDYYFLNYKNEKLQPGEIREYGKCCNYETSGEFFNLLNEIINGKNDTKIKDNNNKECVGAILPIHSRSDFQGPFAYGCPKLVSFECNFPERDLIPQFDFELCQMPC